MGFTKSREAQVTTPIGGTWLSVDTFELKMCMGKGEGNMEREGTFSMSLMPGVFPTSPPPPPSQETPILNLSKNHLLGHDVRGGGGEMLKHKQFHFVLSRTRSWFKNKVKKKESE
jgi:hypothetical protein